MIYFRVNSANSFINLISLDIFLLFKDLSPWSLTWTLGVVDSIPIKSRASVLSCLNPKQFAKNLIFTINKILFWFSFKILTPNFLKHLIAEFTSSDSRTLFNTIYWLIAQSKNLIEIDLSLSTCMVFILIYLFRYGYGKTFI